MRSERDQLTKQVSAIESLLAELGAPVRRGPGRPRGSGAKRGPGRPRKAEIGLAALANTAAGAARRGPGRPKGSKNKKSGPGRRKSLKNKGRGPARPKISEGKRSRPKWSAAAREAARARMKAYWAERRKT